MSRPMSNMHLNSIRTETKAGRKVGVRDVQALLDEYDRFGVSYMEYAELTDRMIAFIEREGLLEKWQAEPDEPVATGQGAARAVNYDAKTGDTIAVRLPGWPAEGYFRVLDTTPERVKLAEVEHVMQQTPGAFAGMWSYEELRRLDATYYTEA